MDHGAPATQAQEGPYPTEAPDPEASELASEESRDAPEWALAPSEDTSKAEGYPDPETPELSPGNPVGYTTGPGVPELPAGVASNILLTQSIASGALNGAFDAGQAAQEHLQDGVSVIAKALQGVERTCIKLLVCVILVVDFILLWPILFSLKVDGTISASWVVIWTPLWIWDALGLGFFVCLVSWGHLRPPSGMESIWKDPFPLWRRVMGLVQCSLCVLFQILLTMRLDDDIDWTWTAVMSPLVAWAFLRLVLGLHDLQETMPSLGGEIYCLAAPIFFRDSMILLQVVFIMLKVEDVVGWSWWVLFTPWWLYFATQLPAEGWCGRWAVPSFARFDAVRERARQVAEAEVNLSLNVDVTRDLIFSGVTQNLQLRRLVEVEVLRLKIRWEQATCGAALTSFISLLLATIKLEGAEMSTFVIFIPQFVAAGVVVLLALMCAVFMSCVSSRARFIVDQTPMQQAREPMLGVAAEPANKVALLA